MTTVKQQPEPTIYSAAYYQRITHDLHLKNGSPTLRLIHAIHRTTAELKRALRKIDLQLADLTKQGIEPTASTPGKVWMSTVSVTPPPPAEKDGVKIPYPFLPDPDKERVQKTATNTTPADLDESYALIAELSDAAQSLGHDLDAALRAEIGIPEAVGDRVIENYSVLSNYGVPHWKLYRHPPVGLDIEVRNHG